MKASYHTHTYRCGHAVGGEREYIEKAIAEGVKILGFADHAPMPFSNGFVSTYKMLPEEIDGYFKTLLDLKEEYKGEIDIKIGFETEYYPSLWEKCLDFWRPYPLDYLILGQHFVPEEYTPDRFYSGWATEDKSRLTAYVDAIISGISTGLITYIAHPDLKPPFLALVEKIPQATTVIPPQLRPPVTAMCWAKTKWWIWEVKNL